MINYQQHKGMIIASFINEDGKIKAKKYNLTRDDMFNWAHCPDMDPKRESRYKSQHFKSVKRNRTKRYLNNYRILEIIHTKFSQKDKEDLFNANKPKMWFMDIEVEVEDGFPNPEDADTRVLTVCFCDQKGRVFAFGLKDLDRSDKVKIQEEINERVEKMNIDIDIDIEFKYKKFKNEARMLKELFHGFISKMSFITGWNFVDFDWLYLVNRAEKLGIKWETISPTNSYYKITAGKKFNKKEDKEEKIRVKMPYHKVIVDYMSIFKKWDKSVKMKTLTNLDFVSGKVLESEKVSVGDPLPVLYKKDFPKFVLYNAMDAVLVWLIHEKLDTFSTMQKLASEGRVQLYEAFYASAIMESLFLREFHKRNVVFVDTGYAGGDTYSGGWVKQPKPGMFEDVVTYDFTSEFPSICMFGNTGIDTLIGRNKTYFKRRKQEVKNQLEKESSRYDVAIKEYEGIKSCLSKLEDDGRENIFINLKGEVEEVNPEKHIVMASGVIYDKIRDSVIRTVLSELYVERIKSKRAANTIGQEIDKLEEMKSAASSH